MSEESETQISQKPADTFTVEDIKKALADAAVGAAELNDQLRDVFSLSDSSATLRLK